MPFKNFKNKIKKIDQKFFNNFIKTIYKIFFYNLIIKLEERKITSLPSYFSKNYGLNSRLMFFKRAQYYLQVNRIDGIYAEFGSHECNTFRMALRTLGLPRKPNKISKFYAFDSFQGMPEPIGIDKQKIWYRSMNFTTKKDFLKIVKKDAHRVVAVEGFFEDTLRNYKFENNEKIALAYIDCDYYSSTTECLNFIKDKLQHGSLIAFDDWDCYYSDPKRGQKLAYEYFKKEIENEYSLEFLCDISSGGRCFVFLENSKIGKDIL